MSPLLPLLPVVGCFGEAGEASVAVAIGARITLKISGGAGGAVSGGGDTGDCRDIGDTAPMGKVASGKERKTTTLRPRVERERGESVESVMMAEQVVRSSNARCRNGYVPALL